MVKALVLTLAGTWFLFAVLALFVTARPADSARTPKLAPLDNDLCMRLALLHLRLDRLRKVNDGSLAQDLREANAEIADAEVDAYNNLSDRVANLDLSELKAAFDNLSVVINALPQDGSIGPATEALREPAAGLARAENALRVRLNCG
jgi:hypothetical protein